MGWFRRKKKEPEVDKPVPATEPVNQTPVPPSGSTPKSIERELLEVVRRNNEARTILQYKLAEMEASMDNRKKKPRIELGFDFDKTKPIEEG